MYKKCWHCKKSYIEDIEELCVDCSVWFSDENEYINNIENKEILEEYGDNEYLNDIGASLTSRD